MKKNDQMSELKLQSFSDRRAYERCDLRISVKLRRQANAAYSSGRSLDVSMGGAGLELVGPREAHTGERIAIAFENVRCPVTRAARMIGAQIVRAGPMHNNQQRVAVRFDAPQAGLEGLELPVAA